MLQIRYKLNINVQITGNETQVIIHKHVEQYAGTWTVAESEHITTLEKIIEDFKSSLENNSASLK